MKTWWHEVAGQRVGPLDVGELRARVMNGTLSRETLVWKAGMEAWRPLHEIDDLDALSSPPPLPSIISQNAPTPHHNQATVRSELVDPSPLNSSTTPLPTAKEFPAAKAVGTRTWVTAGKWKRFLARTFDVGWESTLIGFALSNLGGYLSVALGLATASDIASWSQQFGNLMLFGLLCFPLALAFDAAIYKFFGNTPGKALLGLMVINLNGKPLDFLAYMRRNFRLWFSGYAFGLPFIALLTALRQASLIDRGKPTSYDHAARHRVKARPLSAVNGLAFICLTVVVGAIAIWTDSSPAFFIARHANADAAVQAFSAPSTSTRANSAPAINQDDVKTDGTFWKNPLTQKTVALEPDWVATVHTDTKGGLVTVFHELSNNAVMLLSHDPVTPRSLSGYAKAYQKRFARDIQFNGSGYAMYHKGGPTWVMYGKYHKGRPASVADGNLVLRTNQEIRVELTEQGGRVWCLLSLNTLGDENATSKLYKLREAIKESIISG